MTQREGNLEAPTRHPLDWKNTEFYDKDACLTEMERVFDICHGCRRCVSLCGSFPTLFDLIDESDTMEVDGVKKEDYMKVVDQCYMCDLCYLTKCPYTPPHPWNLDFPHLMLRAKAIQHKEGTETQFRDKILSNTTANGKLASIPVVVDVINAAAKNKTLRKIGEKAIGVHKDAWVPEYTSNTFEKNYVQSSIEKVVNGDRTPGKVAVYSTCYVNWNEPGVGHDLLAVLNYNEIPYVVAEKQACCGMPKLEMGDLDEVEKLMEKNIPQLAKLAREGYAIITPIPSCTLMFKQELPLMFLDNEDVQAVKAAMWDPFDYFVQRNRDGLLRTDFKEQGLGNVSYHIACHLRVQNVGQKTREVLEMIPNTTVNTVERCSGHAGTWGVKKEFHETAMKIGKPVFNRMKDHPGGVVEWIASDCQLAGHHIEQGMAAEDKNIVKHPLSLLAIAYGVET